MASTEERAALVAILRHGSVSWPKVARQVREVGSAIAVAEATGLTAATLFDDSWSTALEQAEGDLTSWDEMGLTLVTVLDDLYPSRLESVAQMPPFFFFDGSVDDADAQGVAVIGSRRATDSTVRATRELTRGLVDAGIAVVSGLAAGVDTTAHTTCLEAGGRTVAVIGTGITRVFPAENQELQQRVARTGLLISQFWPNAAPSKSSFPLRNELMSGWCWASCVMQADERSGARLQARIALAQSRRLFLYRTMESEAWARKYVNEGRARFVDSASDIVGDTHGGAVE